VRRWTAVAVVLFSIATQSVAGFCEGHSGGVFNGMHHSELNCANSLKLISVDNLPIKIGGRIFGVQRFQLRACYGRFICWNVWHDRRTRCQPQFERGSIRLWEGIGSKGVLSDSGCCRSACAIRRHRAPASCRSSPRASARAPRTLG